jgi:hypothetical protein
MTYYADLSPYRYNFNRAIEGVVNIGWLDPSVSYQQGDVPDVVAMKLIELYHRKQHVHVMRGFQQCPFCPAKPDDWRYWIILETSEGEVHLGNAELWIPGKSGEFYASPNLIIHYIMEHHYQPPQEYIDAVLAFELTPEWDANREFERIVGL